MRALVAVIAVVIMILPGSVRAEDITPRPTPIEVAAGVVLCMQEARPYPSNQAVETRGGIVSADLLENSETFATLHRPDGDPSLAIDFRLDFIDASAWNRETARYALNCFNQAYPH